MKNFKKRLTAILLTAALFLTLLPTATVSANDRRTDFPSTPFQINDGLNVLRYIIGLPCTLRDGGDGTPHLANGYWEYENIQQDTPGVNINNALHILRSIIGLPNTAIRRVCTVNAFTGAAPGCGERPVWVSFRAGVTATQVPAGQNNGFWYQLNCGCVEIVDTNFNFTGSISLNNTVRTGSLTAGGNAAGDMTFTRPATLPDWIEISVNGGVITATLGAGAPASFAGTFDIPVSRGGHNATARVEVTLTDGGGTTTTPIGGTTTTTTPIGGSPASTTTVSGTTGTTTTGSPASTTIPTTAPDLLGACRNTAGPAAAGMPMGACNTNGPICPRCGYCHPCDWAWFGSNQCKVCHTGSDCAAYYGIAFCAMCLNCEDDCTCGTLQRFPPAAQTGTCTHCRQAGKNVCKDCSFCWECLYLTPEFEANQDPWGLVICGVCNSCGGCKSVTGGRPC
ncbi:MAG: hypothetical protein FWD35_04685 [Oscillospiraceae bacterium]|nr:hypothetical protein [Oscillospiraceae bacterium]